MRIVVVGAGLAGLTATRRLVQGGHDVALIEAGSRIGGRARTVREPFVDGQYVESGAEWIDTHHHRMRDLLSTHGMELQGEGQQWTTIRRWLHRDGRLQSPADLGQEVYRQLTAFEAIVHDAASAVDDPSNPQRCSSAAELDAISLADVADHAGLDDAGAAVPPSRQPGRVRSRARRGLAAVRRPAARDQRGAVVRTM